MDPGLRRGLAQRRRGLDLRFGEPIVHGNRVVVEWWAVMKDDGREELREYWHLQDGRTDPPEGWGR